jgi:hypothetical protein
MKLATKAKFIFAKRVNRVLCIAFLFLCLASTIQAQKYQQAFDKVKLSDALLVSSKYLNVKVAFDAQKLDNVIVNKKITANSPDDFFEKLLQGTSYHFVYKHGNYLIVVNESQSEPVEDKGFTLLGAIVDSETGEQLPYASIRISELNYTGASTTNGTFYIGNIKHPGIHIAIAYIGYSAIDTFVQFTKPSVNKVFKLIRKAQTLPTVTVKEPKVDLIDYRNDVDFATVLNPSKLIDLPMFAESDIFKALQMIPGISYSEKSSELNIRGGSGDQNLILYDGQTLYNLSHYYGVFSSINPNIIKDIQVFKGGYDSRYGERVSGIVDITGKNGNQLKPSVYGEINLLSGNITAELPISKNVTLIAAARRSYSDVYSTELAQNLFETNASSHLRTPESTIVESAPTSLFYDYNTKLSYSISENENISISAYGGKDYFENTYEVGDQNVKTNTADVNKWTNFGLSSNWQKQWNGAFFSDVQVGTSGYSNKYSNVTKIEQLTENQPGKEYLPDSVNVFKTLNRNRLRDISLTARNIWYLNSYNTLNFGLSARYNSIYYYKDADKQYVYDSTFQSAQVYTAYLQDRINYGKLSVKPGVRFNYYTGNHQFYFEPRFAVNYQFTPKFSMRFATGSFYQYISQAIIQQETSYNNNFWILANDSVHPVLKSNHYILGSSIDAGNFCFDIEAYYKTYNGLQEYIYISPFLKNVDFPDYFETRNQPNPNGVKSRLLNGVSNSHDSIKLKPSYFITGKGRSYGLDFSVRYKSGNFNSWLSYSLSKSLQQFSQINNNEEFAALTDQTHQINWTNMYSFRKWNFGFTSVFCSGRPYILSTTEKPDEPITRTFGRLPNYYRTDISGNYNFTISKFRIKTGATIINIFNTNNYFDVNTRKFDFNNVSFSETNVIRAQGLSFNLFLHFAF